MTYCSTYCSCCCRWCSCSKPWKLNDQKLVDFSVDASKTIGEIGAEEEEENEECFFSKISNSLLKCNTRHNILPFPINPVLTVFHSVLKISEKVSFNIASEASYVYILSGQKIIENAKNCQFSEFLKTWSLQSYSVTRQVNFEKLAKLTIFGIFNDFLDFERTKLYWKCQKLSIYRIFW